MLVFLKHQQHLQRKEAELARKKLDRSFVAATESYLWV